MGVGCIVRSLAHPLRVLDRGCSDDNILHFDTILFSVGGRYSVRVIGFCAGCGTVRVHTRLPMCG